MFRRFLVDRLFSRFLLVCAEEMCTSPAWNFSPTRLNSLDVVSVPFFTRLSYFQNSSSYAPFGCQQNIWSDPSSAHLVRPSSYQVYDPSLQRCSHDLDILSHAFSFRAHQQIDVSRDAQRSMKLFVIDSLEKKARFLILFCRALQVRYSEEVNGQPLERGHGA